MAGCFPLSADINSGCEYISNYEYDQEGLAWSHENQALVTKDSNNRTLITDLKLATGKLAYKLNFRVIKPLDGMTETSEEKPFGITYKVEGKITLRGKTPAAALQKFKLDNDRLVIMVKQSAETGSAKRIIFGVESGLKPMAGSTFDKEQGGYVYNFMADLLSVPQNFFYKTDEAGSLAWEAAMLATGNA